MTFNSQERFGVLTEQLGIEQGRKIICLDVRNSEYKRYQLPMRDGTSGKKLEQLIKLQEHRNSTINQFQYAIEYLVAHGYVVIRLGMPGQDEAELPGSGFIDYANSAYRTPLNDLLLLENSDFLISTVSGPMEVVRSLRKKTLALDVGSLNIFNQSHLSAHTIPVVLPKVIVDVDSGKPLDGISLKASGMLSMNHRELSRFLTTSESYKMVSNSKEAIKQTVELFFTNAIGNAQHPELKVGKELYIQNFGQICCMSCTPCLSPYWINSHIQ
jgi:putative glycosyltransferase (TIGR04372 family)